MLSVYLPFILVVFVLSPRSTDFNGLNGLTSLSSFCLLVHPADFWSGPTNLVEHMTEHACSRDNLWRSRMGGSSMHEHMHARTAASAFPSSTACFGRVRTTATGEPSSEPRPHEVEAPPVLVRALDGHVMKLAPCRARVYHILLLPDEVLVHEGVGPPRVDVDAPGRQMP